MDKNTLLHRQIHPTFITGEKISHQAFLGDPVSVGSDAFMPKPRDNDQLSVYNGEVFTPEHAHQHYTEDLKLISQGVLSLSVEEVHSIEPLEAVADDTPFEGHAHIDFSRCPGKNQKKKRAGMLRDYAVKKGWMYLQDIDKQT